MKTGDCKALRLVLASRCGATTDLSPGVNDRAMHHVDNTYFLPVFEIVSERLKTHTVSNTAFRGFGAPQGILAIERILDAVAHDIQRDPLAVRRANLYAPGRGSHAVSHADHGAHRIFADCGAG